MKRFEGKTALVTGGGSGIGLAAALAYAAEGAQVVVTGRDPEALAKLAAAHPQLIVVANATGSVAAAQALADDLRERGLRLDAVFINAGQARFAALPEITETLWDELFDSNVKGAFFQVQALAPLLNRGAAIVLNGSINAHIGMPNTIVYAASKAALISLARTLSTELLPQGARVNVLSPGPVDTPLYGKLGLSGQALQDTAEQIRAQVPLGRFGTSEEIAATVLHLSSPESAYLVGTEIIADGGMTRL